MDSKRNFDQGTAVHWPVFVQTTRKLAPIDASGNYLVQLVDKESFTL
jgi:hypothetical protein